MNTKISEHQNNYFVYIYRHPTTNIPFYVGYGKNKRHLDHLNEAMRHPIPKFKEHKLNTIREILRAGMTPIIDIVEFNLSKEHACELEIFLISEIGRADKLEGPLTNHTMGGEGNRDWSIEARNKMSKRSKNMIQAKDPKTGIKLRAHKDDPRWVNGELVGIMNGVPCHENTRLAAIRTHKGIPKSKDHNKKNSDALKQLKWYCDFKLNRVGRFKEGSEPIGYIRVSGPHKRKIL